MDVKVTPVHSDEYPAAKAKTPDEQPDEQGKAYRERLRASSGVEGAVARYLKEITW